MTNDGFQIFESPGWVRRADHARPSQSESLNGHEKTVARIVFSRKRNRRIALAETVPLPGGGSVPSLAHKVTHFIPVSRPGIDPKATFALLHNSRILTKRISAENAGLLIGICLFSRNQDLAHDPLILSIRHFAARGRAITLRASISPSVGRGAKVVRLSTGTPKPMKYSSSPGGART
jgi:hypothetical protein